jgi:CheY-like chemotaxis protein
LDATGDMSLQSGRRFLVVDDDESIALLLQRALCGDGDQARLVTTAEEAIQELRHTSFDVLVADVRLPGMTGLELTARARHAHPELPIVVMTADVTAEVEREARRCGADAFVTKPFSPKVLKARVHQLVGTGQSGTA